MPRPKAFNESQVLQKAVDLFWRKGYHATSIQDVVDTLGINRASLYDTYGDKHTLFVKALEKYSDHQTHSMIQFLQGPGSALEKVRVLLEMTVKATLTDREHKGCFMVNAAMELINQDPEIARIAADHQREIESALEQIIRQGQQSGEITTKQEVRALAQFVYCSLNGLWLAGKMHPDRSALEHIVRINIDALKPGMEDALI